MMNELYQLSVELSKLNIANDNWHRKYKPIPNINAKAPCIRIALSGNQIVCLERVSADQGRMLRKYGNNQGTFPAMNLAPLYRIDDVEQSRQLSKLLKSNGSHVNIQEIKTWCFCNNWGAKFLKKYKNSIKKTPEELEGLLQGEAAYEPALRLIQQIKPFAEPQILHGELKRAAFELLEKEEDITLALQILFYIGKEGKSTETDYGSLSVILDCDDLGHGGVSSATADFTRGLNGALLEADREAKSKEKTGEKDAFGITFAPLEEPMPTVKLAGGFEVSLRTMFKGQPCQSRYGRFESDTYPAAPEVRRGIQTALAWLSSAEMRNKTWVNMDKHKILFVYAPHLLKAMPDLTDLFQEKNVQDKRSCFESEAKKFSEYITNVQKEESEYTSHHIQMFMLRKLDKARAKIIYTCCASSDDIIKRSHDWQRASKNLPELSIPYPWTPFPLKIADIMNQAWRQDKMQAADRFNPISSYHGMELLFGVQRQMLEKDLHLLANSCINMALYAGKLVNSAVRYNSKNILVSKMRDSLVLIGMVLYWLGSRKEEYMKQYPYLLGQVLKVSDSLHELYCHEVRGGQIPPRLAGSSMYVAASEMPSQTLAQLGSRMIPYITWAKANRGAYINKRQKNSQGDYMDYSRLSAGKLIYIYEQIASQLMAVMEEKGRFNDYEKAQMFIGYLAAFPKKEIESRDKSENMAGGISDE